MAANTYDTYALVENGRIINVTQLGGAVDAAPGVETGVWMPPDGVDMVRVTDETGIAQVGGTWDGQQFIAAPEPAMPEVVPPTAAQVLAQRDACLITAALRIDPLQDTAELDTLTDAEAATLIAWRRYRIELNRIDQQPGFPANVAWPKAPE